MKKNVARMRYETDKLSSRLCIFAIVFNVIYFLTLYSNNDLAPNMHMGLDVLYNIIFMLIAFLASEKTKAYERSWAYITAAVGVAQILRILWVPAQYVKLGQLSSSGNMMVCALLILSGACMLACTVTCYLNSTALMRYMASEKEASNG